MTIDTSIPVLGPAEVLSPLHLSTTFGDGVANFTADDERVIFDSSGHDTTTFFELAGPRKKVYFRGDEVAAGIVTCGGLCPGMNNVIRALVMQLWYGYGVRRIHGFRYGLLGLTPDAVERPQVLRPEDVDNIHNIGGTVLGSSRGAQRPEVMVDTLNRLRINVLFCIGGDGTMRAAHAIYEEIRRRGDRIAVIGVPKTIDNDMCYIERTFGFDTAVAVASDAIRAAHVEARGAPRGVGLVRLMGRHSGFVAASATLACREVNLVLVPEQEFSLEGEKGILEFIRGRVRNRNHCVVVVAEGAGQGLLPKSGEHDASGNERLQNIGIFLKDRISKGLQKDGITLKYIDPSYIIRAAPANDGDAIFCGHLAQEAVHAAMAGKTGMVIGLWLSRFTHAPLSLVTSGRKVIGLDTSFWRRVLEATGQPEVLGS